MTSINRGKFEALFLELSGDLGNNLSLRGFSTEAIQRFSHCLAANVKGGKLHRGLAVLLTGANLLGQPLSDEQFKELGILGWLTELFQASYLVWDDIMDNSITRRGQPCWYRQPGVGMMAINDACLLKSAIFLLLENYFVKHPSYITFMDLFLKASLQTELGQFCDLLASQENLESFTMDKYLFIVDHKSSFYSLYLPIALALEYLQCATPNNLQQTRRLATALGEYFQVQDDYLDIYGDPSLTGKIGTDIQDNKCTWIINEAILRCNETQLLDLRAAYGKKDMMIVTKVKDIFEELELKMVYTEFEKNKRETIEQMIDSIDESEGLKKEIFTSLFAGFRRGRDAKVT